MATTVAIAQREAAQKQELIDRLAALEAAVKRLEAQMTALADTLPILVQPPAKTR